MSVFTVPDWNKNNLCDSTCDAVLQKWENNAGVIRGKIQKKQKNNLMKKQKINVLHQNEGNEKVKKNIGLNSVNSISYVSLKPKLKSEIQSPKKKIPKEHCSTFETKIIILNDVPSTKPGKQEAKINFILKEKRGKSSKKVNHSNSKYQDISSCSQNKSRKMVNQKTKNKRFDNTDCKDKKKLKQDTLNRNSVLVTENMTQQNLETNLVNEKNVTKNNQDLTKDKTEIKHGLVIQKNKRKQHFKTKLQQMLSEKNEPTMNVKKPTPLRERMMAKLKAAHFRYLNEQMYTQSGKDAKDLFIQDPDSFKAYHEGYQQQVKKWPLNPVNVIIESLKKICADFSP